jgi:transcriptional regulator with XRE-family HTH domain
MQPRIADAWEGGPVGGTSSTPLRAAERLSVVGVNERDPGNTRGVDTRAEIREFLASRRAKITPAQVGLPAGGGRRRVPGLRREEVAVLAGVSTDWYIRLEKGHIAGVSVDVLDAVARALRLDEAERAHLLDLARAARPARAPRRRARPGVRPSIARIVDSMLTTPAFVRNGRLDIVAINDLGRALYAPVFDTPHRPANLARFAFLDPRAHDLYPDWDAAADTSVALLRTEAGRDPDDRDLTDLVGELATRSDAFRVRWAAHDVRLHRSGTKHFHHPVVGRLDLAFEAMELPADPGLTLTAYTPEPGSPSEDALRLLASWAATTPADPIPTSKDP